MRHWRQLETTGGAIRPTSEGERIVTLDVLRGLAIFGILFVNIGIFGFPEGDSEIHRELFGGTADRVIHWATQFLIEGKFYSLFSVLFGIGVAIQFDRARQTGRKAGGWYARRLLVLLAIGLVHDVFIVTGIILMTYSIVGFWLIPFLKRRPKTLLRWTVVMILIPVVVVSVFITVRLTEDDGAGDSTTVGEANEARRQHRNATLSIRKLPYSPMAAIWSRCGSGLPRSPRAWPSPSASEPTSSGCSLSGSCCGDRGGSRIRSRIERGFERRSFWGCRWGACAPGDISSFGRRSQRCPHRRWSYRR